MKNLFIDIASFLKTLTFIDYVLYFAMLLLIILVASLIYLLKTTSIEEEEILEENDEFDIKNAMEEMAQEKPKVIHLTDYEKEQEEKAIISYEELVNSRNKEQLNYESENMLDNEVSVKKINIENTTKESDHNVKVLNYEHEEAFLEALKQLQKLLN